MVARVYPSGAPSGAQGLSRWHHYGTHVVSYAPGSAPLLPPGVVVGYSELLLAIMGGHKPLVCAPVDFALGNNVW